MMDRWKRMICGVVACAADTSADERAWDVTDGACAADEGVATVHHQGPPPGRKLLVPYGGEARECAEDGLLPRAPSEGDEGRGDGI